MEGTGLLPVLGKKDRDASVVLGTEGIMPSCLWKVPSW